MRISLGKYSIFKDESWPWNRHFDVDNFFSLLITLMKQAACWPIDWSFNLPKRISSFSKIVDRLYFGIALVSATHLALLWPYTFFMKIVTAPSPVTTEQLIDISHCLIESTLYMYTVYGLIYYRMRHAKCDELMKHINENFKRRSAIGLTYVTIEPCYLISKKFTFICWSLLFGGHFYVSIYPILTLKWQLPLPLVLYPFDYNYNQATFIATFLAQCIAQWTIGYLFTNFESLLLSSVILVCGQLDILSCSLKNIRYTAMLLNNINHIQPMMSENTPAEVVANEYYYSYEQSEDLTDLKFITGARNKELSLAPLLANGQIRKLGQGRIGDTYLMDYSHELALALRSCINHHKIIVKAHSMMEDFLNPLLLCASFQAPLQICTMAFTLTKPMPTDERTQDLQYFTLTILSLMLIGYAGNSIKQESNRITDALARCPWHLCGGPFRRDMLMFMKNTAKPMVLTGGKFFDVDIDKVKAIISASFSYYTLLQEI